MGRELCVKSTRASFRKRVHRHGFGMAGIYDLLAVNLDNQGLVHLSYLLENIKLSNRMSSYITTHSDFLRACFSFALLFIGSCMLMRVLTSGNKRTTNVSLESHQHAHQCSRKAFKGQAGI